MTFLPASLANRVNALAAESMALIKAIEHMRHSTDGIPLADALRAAADQAERWAKSARELAELPR